MTILELPVSKFSKKIIEAENHIFSYHVDSKSPVIQLQNSSILYKHITIKPIRPAIFDGFTESHLNTSILLQLHDKLAQSVQRSRMHVGAYLNDIHREKLHEVLWWETRELHISDPDYKLQAKSVIECFCDRYDIELDVDINYDTIYKGWTRYKKRKDTLEKKQQQTMLFFRKKRCRNIQSISEKKSLRYRLLSGSDPYPLSDESIEKIIANVIIKYQNIFRIKKGGIERTKRLIDCNIYVLYYKGQRSVCEISKKYNLSEKNIYCRLASFRQIVKKNAITF